MNFVIISARAAAILACLASLPGCLHSTADASQSDKLSATTDDNGGDLLANIGLAEAVFEIRRQLQIVSDAIHIEELVREINKNHDFPEPLDLCFEGAKVSFNVVASDKGKGGVEFKVVNIPVGGGGSVSRERRNTQKVEISLGGIEPHIKDLSDRVRLYGGYDIESYSQLDEIVNKKIDTAELAVLLWNTRRDLQLGLLDKFDPRQPEDDEIPEDLLTPATGLVAKLRPGKLVVTAGFDVKKTLSGKVGLDVLIFSAGVEGANDLALGQTITFLFEPRSNEKAKCSKKPDTGGLQFG